MNLIAGYSILADSAVCWQFQDQQAGTRLEPGMICKSSINSPELNAKAIQLPQLVNASFSDDTPGKVIISGDKIINDNNASSLSIESRCHAPVLAVRDNTFLNSKDFTVELFVKLNTAIAWSSIITKPRDKNHVSWSLGLENNTGQLKSRMDTDPFNAADRTGFNANIQTKNNLLDGKWHHLAAVYDSLDQTMTLYVDYQKAGSRKMELELIYDGNPLEIAGGISGLIDEIRFSNVPLEPHDFMKVKTP